MSDSYKKLCTEFYDISKPEACPKEVEFYHQFLQNSAGPFLEAMSGSGRLLIPLLKRKHRIDGVDQSEEMLESCQRRCASENLQVNLFCQSLENLSLSRQYSLIFIAVGSFQLLSDRSQALRALEKLYEHLLPGGTLLVDTFAPWDFIKESIQGDTLSPEPRKCETRRVVFTPEGVEIELTMFMTLYPQDQLNIIDCRYVKQDDHREIACEEEKVTIRWYYRNEMILLLEKVGLKVERIWDQSFQHNPQAVIFQAKK